MSFAQPAYPLFLLLVVALYWMLPGRRLQNLFLLLASGVFYGWIHPWFVGLLAVSIGVDYLAARGMGRWPERRAALLSASVAANLGLLLVFKYFDFFSESVAAAAGDFGLSVSPFALGVLLPVGISFFTLQSLSYTIDVYRGRLEPRRSLVDVATFVAMFPQLVAGPIERARRLLPQLERRRVFSWGMLGSGASLVLWGAVQKIVVADTVALYVDAVYAMDAPSWALIWAATLGFQIQILGDFSGYTDIARGSARMLGFELMENFRAPYAAASPSEFWRRWHISLSSWIHEYLYVPLGGSRRGPARTALAVTICLLLSGLWHGASWNFALWGLYYVPLILLFRRLSPPRWLGVPLTFGITWFGLLFFRERSIGRIAELLALSPFDDTAESWALAVTVLSVSIASGIFLWIGGWARRTERVPPTLRPVLWALALLALVVFWRDSAQDFIYFQF